MDFNNLINKIIAERRTCVFISPHLDDAALSAGSLIDFLATRVPVKVITIFTESSNEPATLSARTFLRHCGYSDAQSLFAARRIEDIKIFEKIQASVVHLGFVDAAWRKLKPLALWRKLLGKILPEAVHVYPTHRLHITTGKIALADKGLMSDIEHKILEQLPSNGEFVLFCPLAGSIHVDHVITREICRKISNQTIFWLDYPYSLTANLAEELVSQLNFQTGNWPINLEKKQDMLFGYASQVKLLFPTGKISNQPEIFYYPNKLLF